MTEYISKNRVKDYIHAVNSVHGFTSYEDYVWLLNAVIDSPAADVISRKQILSDIEENIKKGESEHEDVAVMMLEMFMKYINEFPVADAQPVKRGKWGTHDVVKVLCSGETLDGFCQCTACGDVFPLHYVEYNFCPNCGEKMDLKEGANNE